MRARLGQLFLGSGTGGRVLLGSATFGLGYNLGLADLGIESFVHETRAA